MIIQLDTNLCTQYGLVLEEALLLKSKISPTNNNEYNQILKLSTLSALSIDKIDRIYEKLKEKEVKEGEANKWAEEFFKTFPYKCTRPDGTTGLLRQGVLKRKFIVEYKKRIKSEEAHKRAMEFMINDVERRRKENSLGWIKSIVNYIMDEPWGTNDEMKYVPYGGDFK